MKLYLLTRTDREASWGEMFSVVVAAKNAREARQIAALEAGRHWGEGKHPWLNPQRTSVEKVGDYTGERLAAYVVVSEFNPE